MTTYTHILDLAKDTEPPADGILSHTIFQDDQVKAVVFGFGQPTFRRNAFTNTNPKLMKMIG